MDYSVPNYQTIHLQRQRKLKNEIRELFISSDPFTFWLRSFEPETVVGQAGIPDREPLANFVKSRTGYVCMLLSEGRVIWAKDEVLSVATEAEGVSLPYWVYKYSLQFERWERGQPVKAADCLEVLRSSEL